MIRAFRESDRPRLELILAAAFGGGRYDLALDRLAALPGLAEGWVWAEGEGEGEGALGCLFAVDYGSVACLGLMAVAPEARRRGIAAALMDHAIAELARRGRTLLELHATPAGAPLYERCGFVDAGTVCHYLGAELRPPAPAEPAAPVRPEDLAEIAAFDAAAIGGDRGPLLARLFAENPGRGWVLRRAGRLMGYVLAQPAGIGPWQAADEAAAGGLLAAALGAGFAGPPAVLAPDLAPAAAALLEAAGFAPQRRLRQMVRGGALPGVRGRVFALANFHMG